jgi:hypothetical protein
MDGWMDGWMHWVPKLMATAGLHISSTFHPHFIHTYRYSWEKMGVGDGFFLMSSSSSHFFNS